MPITITMPALSPTMTEGRLAQWLKNEGDEIIAGDVLAEIETDKATMELEAIDDGILGKILIAADTDGIAVNTPIAIILEEGESASALDGYVADAPVAPTAAPEAAAPEAAAPQAAAPVAAPAATGDRVIASPLARRIATAGGMDIARISGSGPRGRIVKADVLAAQAGGQAAPIAPAIAASAPVMPAGANYEEIPLTNMRKTIARRLVEAKQSIPHIYLTVDCEIDKLLALRVEINEGREKADKISVNDFVVKASALSMLKVPGVNASWSDKAMLQYNTVDISIAVAIDGGLITPVVRNADQKGLGTISAEVKELAGRARDGKLMPEEYQGGGFSISNLGMFGIREFAAIINPPQSAILAVGAGEQRPVVKDGALAVATVMTCTLSCDHRVVDGALGAQFLAAFKNYIQNPLSILL